MIHHHPILFLILAIAIVLALAVCVFAYMIGVAMDDIDRM